MNINDFEEGFDKTMRVNPTCSDCGNTCREEYDLCYTCHQKRNNEAVERQLESDDIQQANNEFWAEMGRDPDTL